MADRTRHFVDRESDVGLDSVIRCCFRKADNFLMVAVTLKSYLKKNSTAGFFPNNLHPNKLYVI